jgi:hypothetical protein
MLDLLLRRKAEVLKYDVRETLAEALLGQVELDTLFALSDARDALDNLEQAAWNGPHAHTVIRDCEKLLRSWNRAA